MPRTAEIFLRGRHNGEPILFATERGALEYMYGIEMKTQSAFTEFEVREVI